MSDHEVQNELKIAYRRASIGLAIAAIVWTAAFVVGRLNDWSETTVLIPAGAAALSAICYVRYRRLA